MSGILKKVEQKLGDHPNVNSDPNINPDSGTGKDTNQGYDQDKSWVTNKVQAGMGSDSRLSQGLETDEKPIKAGSTTSDDTTGSGQASGLIEPGSR